MSDRIDQSLPVPEQGPVPPLQNVDSDRLPDPVQPVASASADESAVPEESWTRFHKATPWLSVWQVWAAIGAFIVSGLLNVVDTEEDVSTILANLMSFLREILLYILAGIIILTVLGTLAATLSWRKKEYAFVPSGIHFRQGVFTKKHRHVRWDRIQSVQIRQGIIARLFGLGSLDIDSAAGSSGMLSLGLLKTNELSALRGQILATAEAARKGETLPDGATQRQVFDVDDVYEGQRPFYTLGMKRLVVTTVMSSSFITFVLFVAAAVVTTIATGEFISFAFLLALVPAVTGLWSHINTSYGHTMFLTKDGIRVRRGLTKTTTQTLLPGKIHALDIVQPFLWRPMGWWKVTVTMTGGMDMTEGEGVEGFLARDVLVPAGSQGEALTFLWTVLPDIGVDEFESFFDDALSGTGASRHFVTAPSHAKLLDPFGHKRNGYCLTRTAAVARSGYFRRHVRVVLHAHWQGLNSRQGFLQRRKDLATGSIALIPGLVTWKVKNMNRDDIVALRERELALGAEARAVQAESIDEWARRVGVA